METETAIRIAYVRRRKQDRPTCPLCGAPFWAGSTQGPITYYYPGCRCIVRNRKMYRPPVAQYVQRLLFGLLILVCSAVSAQQPRAVVTGPKEARCGALIVLDGTASEGVGRLWLLAVAPEETSFLPVESATKCIFASPTPGRYEFVMIVAGTNANGGPAVDMARHTVTLAGGVSPPPFVPTPDEPLQPPPPNPSKKATRVTYVYEKDKTAIPRPVQSALQLLNAGGQVVASDFEQDVTDGTDDVPDQYKTALTEAKKAGIPALVVEFSDGTSRVVKDPKTAEQIQEAVKP